MPQSRTRLSAPVSQISLCDSGTFQKGHFCRYRFYSLLWKSHIHRHLLYPHPPKKSADDIHFHLPRMVQRFPLYILPVHSDERGNKCDLSALPQHAEYTSFPAISHPPVPAYGAMLSGFFCHSHPECSVVHKGLFHNPETDILPAVPSHRFLYQISPAYRRSVHHLLFRL